MEDEVALDLADVAGARYGADDDPDEKERFHRTTQAVEGFRVADGSDPASLQRQVLWSDSDMRAYIELLAGRFVLLVRFSQCNSSERRIIKFSHEERIQNTAEVLGRVGELIEPTVRPAPRSLKTMWSQKLETIGWKPYGLTLPTRALYAASTDHAEVVVPSELFIEKAILGRVVNHIDPLTGRATAGGNYEIASRERVSLAHLYGTGVAPGSQPESFSQPDRSGSDPSELGMLMSPSGLGPGRYSHYSLRPA